MNIAVKKIAVLVDNYFEESELSVPFKLLTKNKKDVTIISSSGKQLRSMDEASQGKAFDADLLLKDADSKDYDALVLPGGIFNANSLRLNEKARSWAVDFIDSGKLLAAPGYSSLLLVSADLVEERQLTSPPEIQDDIKNAGGEWTNRPVVVDGNLITSRGSEESKKFSESILERLG